MKYGIRVRLPDGKAGLVNERVLVEEFAPGAEYLVDTYSVDGRHGLVDVCRYTKINRGDRARGEFRDSYRLVQYVRGVFISAPRAGVWRNAEVFAEVESLKRYHAKNFPHGTGDRVPATDDMFTFLAWVILVGPDEDALDGDYRQIKEWERQIVIDGG